MIKLDELTFVGENLVRPECVLMTRAGFRYVSDFRGGISCIDTEHRQSFFGGSDIPGYGKLKPNGFALLPDGSFLVAHLGETKGGVFSLKRDGTISPFLLEVEGQPLPPSNFVFLDHQGRIWITVSTGVQPRADAYRADIKDGFIIVVDQSGARIVADGIGYTNELYVEPSGKHLYVNATFSRELLRFDITAVNDLVSPVKVCSFGYGTYPDGLTMDQAGDLWVTSIVSNRLIRVNALTGEQSIELEDVDPNHLDWVEQAYLTNTMGRRHLDAVKSSVLNNISSLAFGGENNQSVTLGCLLGDKLATLQSSVAGMVPSHWEFDD